MNELRKKNQRKNDYWEVQRIIDKQVSLIENEKDRQIKKRSRFPRNVFFHIRQKTESHFKKWREWFKCLF